MAFPNITTYSKQQQETYEDLAKARRVTNVNSSGDEIDYSGFATEAKQDTLLTELEKKANLTETQPVSNASLPLPTGASTAAKQLPNDHDVNVSNMIPAVETGLATSDNQTNGDQKVKVLDGDGLPIGSSQDSDGNNHLSTAFIQDINSSVGNSTTTNIAAGSTFTGTSEETFGINGIQVYHFADRDCTIYIDQSLDSTNWDIVDSWDCLANRACTRTFTSVSPYYRARVRNNATTATTEIRFATGLTPVINPLPRALTDDDRLKTETTITGRQNEERHAFISPLNALTTLSTVRLVGTSFDGTTKDPNFWTETVANGGTVVQGGAELVLSTNTTANGAATYQSVQRGRYVVSRPLKFFGFFAMATDPQANNLRRIGAYDVNDGFFFQVNGTTFSIGTRKATSDTLVNNGSFNGNYGPTLNLEADERYYKVEIEYGAFGVKYYIDDVLLHSLGREHWVNTFTLPVKMENINSNGNTTNNIMDCTGAVIIGQGEYLTSPIYKYISGASTNVLKYGSGILHAIINNDNSGSLIAYDNTAGSGTIIASIDLAKVLGTLTFDAPFSNGLTIVTTGSGAKITATYE